MSFADFWTLYPRKASRMMAEKALKKAHDAVLSQNLDIAVEQTLIALTEARLMLTALKEMREKSTTNE